MTNAGASLSVLSAAVVGLGAVSFGASKKFNEAMANVGSLIPGNTARVQELKREVQDMAVELGKSTSDLSGGLYQVVSAFGDTADSVKVLEINARAAKAGLAETTDAINLTSGVTKAYGDTSAAAVQKVSDLALLTVRLGQTTFPELAASMGRVTPLANELKVSQEELFAVMATATGVTGGAAEVSTQFRGVLQSLLAPTADMTGLIQKLGFESGQAMVEQLGAVGAMQKIVAAAEASGTPLQKYISSIEGQTLALALAGPQADTFKQKLAEMGNAAGTTDAAFREQTEGVNAAGFKWDQFKVKMEVVAQRMGDALAPALMKLAQMLEPVIAWVEKGVAWFAQLDPRIQTVAVAGLAAVAALGPLLLIAGQLATAVGALIPIVTAVGAVIAGISAPVAIAVAAIVALGAALVVAWQKSETFRSIVIGAWDVVKAAAGSAFDGVRSAITTFVGALVAAWEKTAGFRDFAGQAWAAIKETAVGAIQALVAFLAPIWGEIVETFNVRLVEPFRALWESLSQFLSTTWTTIVETVNTQLIEPFKQFWAAWGDEIMTVLQQTWDNIVNALTVAWDIIKSVVQGALDVISNTIQLGLNLLQGDWSEAWGNVKGIVAGVGDAIIGVVKAMWEGIERQFTEKIAAIKSKVEGFRDAVIAPFEKMREVIVGNSIVPEMVTAVVAEFETMKGKTEKRTKAMVASIVSQFSEVQVAVSKLSDAGARHIEGLIQQQAQLSMTEEQYRRFQLQMQGVTAAEIEAILEMERHIEATKANRAGVVDLLADLERQAKSLGVVTEKTIAQRVAELELTDAQRQSIAVLQEKIAQQEFQNEVLKVIEEENKKAAKAEEEHAKAVEDAKGRIEAKLKGMVTQALPEWAQGWEQHWKLATDVFTVFGEDIGSLLQGLLGKFGDWLGGLGGLFEGGLGGLFDKVKGFMGGIGGLFDGGFGDLLGKAGDLFGGLGGLFEGGFGGMLGKAGDFVKGFGDKLLGGLGLDGVFGSVSKFIGGPWGMAITTALDLLGIDVGQAVQKIGKVAVDGLVAVGKGIASAGGAILGGLGDVAGGIASVFGGGMSEAEKIAAAAAGTSTAEAARLFREQFGTDPTSFADLGRVNVPIARVGGPLAQATDLVMIGGQRMGRFSAAGMGISQGMATVSRAAGSVATPRVGLSPAVAGAGFGGGRPQEVILEVDRERLGRVALSGGISSGRRSAGIRDY